jgi:hypothetical protein
MARSRVLSRALLQLIGSRPVVAYGNVTHRLNLNDYNYKQDKYT